jgi:hypothetical protein
MAWGRQNAYKQAVSWVASPAYHSSSGKTLPLRLEEATLESQTAMVPLFVEGRVRTEW